MPLVFSGDPGKDDPAPFTFSASHTPTKKIGTVVVDVYHQKSSGKDGKATASATLCAIGTNQAPVLTLLGSSLISLTVGASYADAGATATDTEDGDLTSSIVVTGAAVDTSVPGTSTVRYNVKDSFDVPATELTRTIVVSASASSSGQGTSTDQGEGDGADGDAGDGDTGDGDDGEGDTEGGDNDNEGDEENDENNGTTTNTTTEVATSSKTVGGGGKLLNAAKKSTPAVSTAPADTDVSTTAEEQGEVLGASCTPYLTRYLKRGADNNAEDVKKLQTFLNKELGLSIPVTGYFGPLTEDAVRAFQLKYSKEILTPWLPFGLLNESMSTGYVYKTTLRWINKLSCPDADIPMPSLP